MGALLLLPPGTRARLLPLLALLLALLRLCPRSADRTSIRLRVRQTTKLSMGRASSARSSMRASRRPVCHPCAILLRSEWVTLVQLLLHFVDSVCCAHVSDACDGFIN